MPMDPSPAKAAWRSWALDLWSLTPANACARSREGSQGRPHGDLHLVFLRDVQQHSRDALQRLRAHHLGLLRSLETLRNALNALRSQRSEAPRAPPPTAPRRPRGPHLAIKKRIDATRLFEQVPPVRSATSPQRPEDSNGFQHIRRPNGLGNAS